MKRPTKVYCLVPGYLFGNKVNVGDEVQIPDILPDAAVRSMLDTGVVSASARKAEKAAEKAVETQPPDFTETNQGENVDTPLEWPE